MASPLPPPQVLSDNDSANQRVVARPPSPPIGRLPALGFRDFRIFWLGQLVSLTGTWVQSVAQQWLVLQLTGSAFKLGLVTAVQFTPLLFLSLIGGVVTDRLPKRNLLIATQISAGLLALGLGLLVQTGTVQYWHVLVIAGLLGTVNAFYVPARQAFVPELVDKDILINAVALNSTIFNMARIIGPAIGGLLVASLGLSLNFFLNAASYLAVIIGLFMIHPRPVVVTAERKNMTADLVEGIRYVAATPRTYTILALVGVASLFALNFTTILPLFASSILHVGSAGFGLLMASMGMGSLIGAISLTLFDMRDRPRLLIYAGAFVFTVAEVLFALSRLYALSLVLLIIVGLFTTLFTTTANSRILTQTPAALQGRVMSVYSLMFLGMTPFGSFLAGVVAERFGAPVALVGGAAITFAFALAVFIYRPTQRAQARLEGRALR